MFRGKEIDSLGTALREMANHFEENQREVSKVLQKIGQDMNDTQEKITKVSTQLEETRTNMSEHFLERLNTELGNLDTTINATIRDRNAEYRAALTQNYKEMDQIKARLDEMQEMMKSVAGTKFDEFSQQIKTLNKELNSSSEQAKLMQKDLGELAAISKSLDVIREKISNLENNTTSFESRFATQETAMKQLEESTDKKVQQMQEQRMQAEKQTEENEKRMLTIVEDAKLTSKEIQDQFAVFRQELLQTKDRVVDEERQIISLETSLREKEIQLREKSERLITTEKELAQNKSIAVKFESKADNLEREVVDLRKKRDELTKQVIGLEKEFTTYKASIEPAMAQNTHIKELLAQTELGRIFIELQKTSPLSLEQLSERLGVALVIVRNAVYAMQDMRIVSFDLESREVKLRSI